MSFDAMLKKVGSHGRYQIVVLIFVIFAKCFPDAITVMPVLVAGKMDYQCKISLNYLGNNTNEVNVTAEECHLLFNNSETGEYYRTQCDEWTFLQDKFISTIRSTYNLVCDREYLVQLSITLYFIGIMLGCTAYGYISDRYGRIVSLFFSISHLCLFSTASAFAPNIWCYILLRFLAGIGSGGQLTTFHTMLAEVTDPKYRTIWLMVVQNGTAIGVGILCLTGYFVRNHFYLQLLMSVPVIGYTLNYFLFYESPRWLYGTGQIEKADKVLRKISKYNGRDVDKDFSLRETYECYKQTICSYHEEQNGFIDVFRYPGMLRTTLLVWYNCIVVSMGYYGMIFMLGDIGGSVYVNLAVISFVEVPAGAIGLLFAVKIGRRYTLVGSYAISGVVFMACASIYNKRFEYRLIFLLTLACGHFFFIILFNIMNLYLTEIFPTVIRNMGVGLGSTWARVGAMVAPQIGLLSVFWPPLPFIVLSVFPVLASIGSFFLPETQNRLLAETLEEGEHFVQGRLVQRKKEDIEVELEDLE